MPMFCRTSVFLLATLLAADGARAAETAVPGVDAGALIRLIVGLIAVLAMILALAWLLKRSGGVGRPLGGKLRVLGALSVGQRERVVLVQVGEKQLLLGVAPGRVQALHVLEQPLEGPEEPPRGAAGRRGETFAERLRGLMQPPDQKK